MSFAFVHSLSLFPSSSIVAQVLTTLSPSSCAVTLESNSTVVAPGSGPRHIAFYPPSTGLFVYLASELASTLTAFKRSPSDGTLTQLGSPVSSMPEGIPLVVSPGTNRSVAEVAVSPDGRFVYVSDRGDPQEDHISIFKRSEDGTVSFEKWVGSGGRNVRHVSRPPPAARPFACPCPHSLCPFPATTD